jgi:hypothetical protein
MKILKNEIFVFKDFYNIIKIVGRKIDDFYIKEENLKFIEIKNQIQFLV